MSRQRRIDEQLWEDDEEALSSDHVVERFFSQHEREDAETARRGAGPRPKRRTPGPPTADD